MAQTAGGRAFDPAASCFTHVGFAAGYLAAQAAAHSESAALFGAMKQDFDSR